MFRLTSAPATDAAHRVSAALSTASRAWREAHPGEAMGVDALAEVLRPILAAVYPPGVRKGRDASGRNTMCDALAEACGIDPLKMTTTAARTCAVKVLEIIAATPDVDAAEMRRRAAKFRKQWPGITLTPAGLAKQWAACADAPAKKPAPATIPEPPNWRARLIENGFDHIMRDDPRPWAALMPSTQDTILKALVFRSSGTATEPHNWRTRLDAYGYGHVMRDDTRDWNALSDAKRAEIAHILLRATGEAK